MENQNKDYDYSLNGFNKLYEEYDVSNEEKKLKFKNDNFIRHIDCCNDGSKRLYITSYPRNMDINNKIYDIYVFDGSTWPGYHIFFNDIYDAQEYFLDKLWGFLERIRVHIDDKISLYQLLITVDIQFLNKKLLQDAESYDIIFTKCKELDNYIIKHYSKFISRNRIYIIKREWIKIFNEKFKLNFIELNLLLRNKNISNGEKNCNIIMKELYPYHLFEKIRPSFLLNVVSNYPLELDLYNDKLKIAVEYNGKQHYEFCPYFHKSKEDFEKQKYRDSLKNELCKKNGIKLINIHYSLDDYEKIKEYIQKELNI
jgi:hypothetical protein